MNYEGMVVDREKTTHYYKELSIDSLCDCDYCRLYHSKSKTAYPELTDWLMKCGIDIEKPFETMWIDPDENGFVNYIGVQYIVIGTCEEQFQCLVGDITIRRIHSLIRMELKTISLCWKHIQCICVWRVKIQLNCSR